MERRLAAILAADVVGYSRLMGADEKRTLASLRSLRAELFGPTVARQGGKVIKSMGDGWLVVFESAVDAVGCAMQLQDRLTDHELIKLRIGAHIGDIAFEDEDIFGDAVNVAARLEEFAEPGGVAISEAAYSSLDGTLSPSFDDAGLQDLKNIERPLRVWTRTPRSVDAISDRPKTPSGAGDFKFPSLAIEPVLTSDDRGEVRELADALTSDVESYLCSTEWLRSAITVKSGHREFSLRLMLRARQQRLRLETKLTHENGETIWTEKYDGDLSNSFEWQDTVGEAVASSVLGRIRDVERQQLAAKQVEEMSAEECLLCGLLDWNLADQEAVNRALGFFRASIEKDSTFTLAHSMAISFLFAATAVGYKDAVKDTLPHLEGWLERTSSLPLKSAAEEISITAVQYHRSGGEAELRTKIKEVLRQSPFSAHVLGWSGWCWVWLGEPQKALDCFQKFQRIGRFSPYSEAVSGGLAVAYVQAGRYEAAINHCEQALKSMRGLPPLYRALAAANAKLGRIDDASVAIAQLLRLVPDDSISGIHERANYADSPATLRYFEGLRLAGLPE